MELDNKKIRRRKLKIFGSVLIATAAFALILIDMFETKNEAGTVLGDREQVIILTDKGPVTLTAKIDTGADFSAIDSSLATSLNLKQNKLKRRVTSAQGVQVRDTANADFILGNKQISSIVSLADRSQLSTDMIIGRSDMGGFTIDPNREFLNEPKTSGQKFSPASWFIRASDRSLNKLIIIFPILGAIVVALRLIVGMRTYGIFAPVVIALSLILMSPNLFQGILVYIALISVGVSIKILFFNRLKLPNVAEMALIMASIVLALLGFSFLPLSFQITAMTVFFPLIITTHLVERFSKTTEEHRISEAVILLVETLLVALLLTFIGLYLTSLSTGIIWLAYIAAAALIYAIGNYTGLRLSEIYRFKFLRK